MKTFKAKLQFPSTFNLQPPLPKLELPVLTPEGPRKATIVAPKPDGSGFGWELEFEYDESDTSQSTLTPSLSKTQV